MGDFDDLVKSKIKNENWETPKAFDKSISTSLDKLENRKTGRIISRKVIVIVAAIIVLNVTTVFAITPQGKELIKGVVDFFSGKYEQKYISDKGKFDEFNKAIGISVEDKGIKVTLDNIAVDDSFLNTFYTIESTEPINKVEKDTPWTANFAAPFLITSINGDDRYSGNNNNLDAYFKSDKVLKVMKRENISQVNINDTFNLKIKCDEIFGKKGSWELTTKVNKNDVKVDTTSVNPNKKATINLSDYQHNINIDKVILSPFGNQIVISEETSNDRFFSLFALFDDKGNSLDVLNTDLAGSRYGKVTNSYEFIKANKETKFITLVPIEWKGENIKKKLILKELYNLPVTLDISKNGKIIIQDIQFDKNVIKINYKKDGVVVYDPSLNFYDEKGNEIDLGETYLVDKVDRENGTYTEIRTFANNNVNLSKIKKIGFYSQDDYKILRDQAIKIDFK
ncbi:hypothetical protein B0P06_005094 [Clostridium saccharoperbutylacetonicum]|uniref:DUF4179 domain-containing protein n=1 Tax=Clostridium saccharoperbutylacetonicum N1-4(HMT) TaxID=931276 RepID=M1MPG9_9CLOT|nr:DUF4179 domain-containing protein [Clostridium saccharoperbutylacetonicum]AGF56631.1 hypothetical protein DUF4179 [Clostridium saccharoperbutylacetonicum N1-4(HMT)]NRT62618.1 hypothetical protein [Clostridium saccharoperbutylacetonicum]NSB25965.1 hypothetical protein [Clostridium saccharoperbutylacetonicum]NSB45323.1 hypothetical protein [Clostridium saccharoperbutylacetonicum]